MDLRKDVLDHGYVRIKDFTGADLSTVNAARVSYDSESELMELRDVKLTKFLAKHGHTSPFRHAFMTFEVYAPLFVARQWWKYIIGSGHTEIGSEDPRHNFQDPFTAWNESSRRYVTEDVQYYLPHGDQWRAMPDNKKQGSGQPVPTSIGSAFTSALVEQQYRGTELYEQAMKQGICAEQARLFLPAYGLYVRWVWSASLQGVSHFLTQRLAHDAQVEIQEYAQAVNSLAEQAFPVSIQALIKRGDLDAKRVYEEISQS